MNDVHARLTSWFASPVDAQWSSQLANIIRACEASLTPVWHPLGFIHVKLAQGEMKDTFRMHVWSSVHRDAREQGDKIHDHLFHVRSRVVFGSIKNIRYRFTPNAHGNHREVRIDYTYQDSSLRETNLYGDIEEISADVFRAPTEYVISTSELHETLLFASELAMTVVHTTEPADYRPRAIFRRDSPLPSVRTPVLCNKTLWHGLLQQMLPL
jgi:hypothetical protein